VQASRSRRAGSHKNKGPSHTSLMEVQRFRAQLQCRHRRRAARQRHQEREHSPRGRAEQESSHTSLMEVQRFRAQLQCRHRRWAARQRHQEREHSPRGRAEQESSHTSLMEVQRFRAQLQCRHRTRPANGQPDRDTKSVSAGRAVERRSI
jgi:hypothetical protein